MGEYISTTVSFGGKVKRSNLAALSEVMLDGGEDDLEDAHKEKGCIVTQGETNFGRAEELCALLEELGLSYRRSCDAKYEYDGETEIFNGATGQNHEVSATQGGDPYLTYLQLRDMAKKGKQLSDVIAVLAQIAEFAIPPLEIVEEDPFEEAAREAGWKFHAYEDEAFGGFWWRPCKEGETTNDPMDEFFPDTAIMSADTAELACEIDKLDVGVKQAA
jgi:hypothetical protein